MPVRRVIASPAARLAVAAVAAGALGFALGLAVSEDPDVDVTVAQPTQPEAGVNDRHDPSTFPGPPTDEAGSRGASTVTAPTR
jgi:hypothetical protein